MNKSSLSAGEIIRQVLMSDETLKRRVSKIFPVIEDKATLPYVVYRRGGMSQNPVKTGRGADTIVMQVIVYAKSYKDSVEIAEMVRDLLDGAEAVHLCSAFGVSFSDEFGTSQSSQGLTMRSCYLSDASEEWANDAFIQNLIFTIKI